MSSAAEATDKPKATAKDSRPEIRPDIRGLAERFSAVRAKLGPNCIEKRGMKRISGVEIWYVTSDDLLELIRPLLAPEGLDVRIGMDPNHPIKEVLVKTAKGTRVECQCWFKITAKCAVEEDCDWWLAQDADIGIASTYAYKFYLMKRLQLSGLYQDHSYEEGETIQPQEARPANGSIKVDAPQRRQGPPPPAEISPAPPGESGDSGPDDSGQPCVQEEWAHAWEIWRQYFKADAKKRFTERFPHIKNPEQATKGDVREMEAMVAGEAPF